LNVINMADLATAGEVIIAGPGRRAIGRALVVATVAAALAGCYPRYDWRDYRPDCARGWCGFVASFPGKATTATREIPVGALRLPLTASVVSVGDVSFAVLAFDLLPGSDRTAARASLETKVLDDVGASSGRRGTVTLHAADRSDIPADTFDADADGDRRPLHATARFAERRGYLVEILVVGPADVLSTAAGRQAVETFVTSVRLD
jgi:hypothetical protein